MPLPTFHCPACRNPLTAEVVLANEAIRQCVVLLIDAHPGASGLLRPLLAYIGLFAPAKQAIRYERMADLLEQLVPMIRSCEVERGGQRMTAPLEYWRQALEDVVSRGHGGGLKLPLKTHGYLLEVVAQLATKADAHSEARIERQRQGHAGLGTAPARADQTTSQSSARAAMPEHIRAQLLSSVKKKELSHDDQSANT